MSGLTIGDLTGFLRMNDSGMRRGLDDADLRMRGFQRDVEGRLRHIDGRFATTGEQIAAGLRTGSDEGHRFSFSLGRIAGMAGGLGGVAMSIGRMAAMLGAAVPLAAGLVAAVGNIAPAAALAVSAMIAMQLATKAFELGMVGVKEAITAALDPSKAEEFDEALKKLSPSAQAFAKQVKALQPEFKKLQQDVQERMFKALDGVLKRMSTTTLPVLRKGLVDAGGALNLMAKGVGNAAVDLAKEGTLGKAIKGATAGLTNLSRVPGQFVKGLTQVGAAAAPAFARLTKSAGSAFDRISEKITKAFESGRMEAAIERAIDLIGEIAKVAVNVGRIIGSIFDAADAGGGGFLVTLQEITGALADAFASKEVQAGLRAIFQTMATLAKTVAPLLGQALQTLAPIFAALGPPIQILIKALGQALKPIIKALGPVLLAAAKAVGALLEAVAPLLPIFGQLIADLLPILTPLFEFLGEVFERLAPLVQQLAANIAASLAPILQKLPGILDQLLPKFLELADRLLPLLLDILVQLGPQLGDLALAFAELLVELTPLLIKFLEFQIFLLDRMMPIIGPLAKVIGGTLVGALLLLTRFLTEWVIPIVRTIVALFNGDWAGAMRLATGLTVKLKEDAGRAFESLKSRGIQAAVQLASGLVRHAKDMGSKFVGHIQRLVSDTVLRIASLPARILGALSGMGSLLWSAGWNLIGGFIDGILARVPNLKDNLNWVTSMLPSWKGPEDLDKRILAPAGQRVMSGFMRGISSQIPALRSQLQGLTGQLPGMSMGLAGGVGAAARTPTVRIEVAGPDSMKALIRKITLDDGGGSVQRAFGQG